MPSEPAIQPWYAVQTRPGSERLAAARLAHKGYEVFLPLDRARRCETPLFPCYLFCRRGGAGQIVTTPGVVRLLGAPGRPEPVPEEEVEDVRKVLAANLQVAREPQFAAGERVRICRGPLRGVVGWIVDRRTERRLVVTIRSLERSISIAVEPEWLTRCGA